VIKSGLCLSFFVFYIWVGNTQKPVKEFDSASYDSILYEDYATNKKIPQSIRPQVLTALSFYPELKDSKIIFRFKKRKTPLTSRPRIFSVFRGKKKRAYVITLSSETKKHLAPILFSKLPYNAQVGVLGHEIGHIVEYKEKSSVQLIGLSLKLFNSTFVDSFEFETDKRTIEHGLGYQLLDWSIFVRQALNITEWKGASKELSAGNKPEVNQRYMNPETIRKYIKNSEVYSPELN
jgi:hypothetical protein